MSLSKILRGPYTIACALGISSVILGTSFWVHEGFREREWDIRKIWSLYHERQQLLDEHEILWNDLIKEYSARDGDVSSFTLEEQVDMGKDLDILSDEDKLFEYPYRLSRKTDITSREMKEKVSQIKALLDR